MIDCGSMFFLTFAANLNENKGKTNRFMRIDYAFFNVQGVSYRYVSACKTLCCIWMNGGIMRHNQKSGVKSQGFGICGLAQRVLSILVS